MATLPNIPVNTATVIGGLAAMGLIAYQQTLRTKIESQVHANYRDFKFVDAGVQPETAQLSVAQ
jgi:uncharacterized membrane protein YebE (DUF533 family)